MIIKLISVHGKNTQKRFNLKLFDHTLPKLGLLYLAAVAEKRGHQVEILDLQVETESTEVIYERMLKKSPDIIGFSMTSAESATVYSHTSFIKNHPDYNPEKTDIIVGGPHATVMPLEVVEKDLFDYVFLGESETSFDLYLKKKEENDDDFTSLTGLIYKKDGEIVHQKRKISIEDLDNIPVPAFHLLKIRKYNASLLSRGKYAMHIITSRGCPGKCIFCNQWQIFGRQVRTHSVERVIQEVNILKGYGVDYVLFLDGTFTVSKERTIALCKELEKVNIRWGCWTRADCVDDELLKYMKQARCDFVQIGAETGTDSVMQLIGKDETVEDVRRAVNLVKKNKMHVQGNFMLNLPGEGYAEEKKTLEFAKELNLDLVSFGSLIPNPGTIIYNNIEKYGEINRAPKKLNQALDVPFIPHEKKGRKDLEKLVNNFYFEYYYRLAYLPVFFKQLIHYPIKKIPLLLYGGTIVFFKILYSKLFGKQK